MFKVDSVQLSLGSSNYSVPLKRHMGMHIPEPQGMGFLKRQQVFMPWILLIILGGGPVIVSTKAVGFPLDVNIRIWS